MLITELCDLLEVNLTVEYTPKAVGPWITRLKKSYGDVNYKDSEDDVMLRGCCGWGKTPNESVQDFIKNLKEHKFIVIDSSKFERQKVKIPEELKY